MLTAGSFAACGHSPANPSSNTPRPVAVVTALRIDGLSQTLLAGDRKQLSAIVTFSDGTNGDVTHAVLWQTSNPAIAAVITGGVLLTFIAGTVDITASFQGTAATARIVIEPRPVPPVTSISGRLHEPAPREAVPVAGARLTISDGRDAGKTTTSTINGQFLFDLSGPAPFTIWISKPGYADVPYRIVELSPEIPGPACLSHL